MVTFVHWDVSDIENICVPSILIEGYLSGSETGEENEPMRILFWSLFASSPTDWSFTLELPQKCWANNTWWSPGIFNRSIMCQVPCERDETIYHHVARITSYYGLHEFDVLIVIQFFDLVLLSCLIPVRNYVVSINIWTCNPFLFVF